MATVYYVEHRSASGEVFNREPVGSLKEAAEILTQMLAEPDVLAVGDIFEIIDPNE